LEIGIKSDKIIVDPGIGFAKTVGHNLEIIHHLRRFEVLRRPVLIGVSRKSFIGKVLEKDVSRRLYGSLAGACAGILNGAHMIRAHDVGATKESVAMIDAIINGG
jgi:dihydropteroate synthase